ncbi:GTPase Era [secondary endosymbiont of Trabutina mannipara]|uniref:GTPase Era n=1 Tax=secondary endosymbiont of Trabutina mannipara TaxID=1835721 RepID=A0A1C3L431_9ENTR|nr:GTPase Era [secondary endosymbiont of Trabutina mannipara]SBT82032.1 GTPase Era [secondary endosymbiont of Trabutina mannipara]
MKKYCGFVAIVGRSNVGKSTLLNKLLKQKISITSSKPQTTRYKIMGINTVDPYQTIYLDTPGIHIKEKKEINFLMNRVATSSISDVEIVIFVVEGTKWMVDDEIVINKLQHISCPIILAINKIDNIINKKHLLPHIKLLSSKKIHFHDIVPISSKNGMNINILANIVRKLLPESIYYFPKNYITDRSKRFRASEIIREILINFLEKELPYSITVEIEKFQYNDIGVYDIHGIIFVERISQKKIVIGNKGSKIKIISVKSKKELEFRLDTKVNLKLWVKVKSGWTDNQFTLRSLGYN